MDALKRRRFMELQQTLAYELRSLAREASKRCCIPRTDEISPTRAPLPPLARDLRKHTYSSSEIGGGKYIGHRTKVRRSERVTRFPLSFSRAMPSAAAVSCTQERDRLLAEKAAEREAMADAKRFKMLEAADRARLARERFALERQQDVEREAAAKRARQEEATRCAKQPLATTRKSCRV